MGFKKESLIESLVKDGVIDEVPGRPGHYTTRNMDIFKRMPGNRNVDEKHVKSLVNQFGNQGNLTNDFPIVVTEDLEIVDGQHRVEVFRNLEWTLMFNVRPSLTINQVRTINSANKNWSWRDYAVSFSELGNEQYTNLLTLVDTYGYVFTVISYYCDTHKSGESSAKRRKGFKEGDFVIENLLKTRHLLNQYQEIEQAIDNKSRELAHALKDVMLAPGYDQTRMLRKIKDESHRLESCHTKSDYLRALEEIYNFHMNGPDRVRLF